MNNIKFLLLLFALSILTTSCGDDDSDSGSKSNQVTYLGESDDLTAGALQSYGGNADGSFDWDVTLVGGTLTVNSQGISTGEGPELYLDLNTNSSTGLVNGTYDYSDGNRMAFNFVDANLDNIGSETEITGGTVTISASDIDAVDISFNLEDDDGNPVTGSYIGALILVQ